MKGKVNVFIEGKTGDDETGITVNTVGEYRFFNGKHIIMYKEPDTENGKGSDNIIKAQPGLLEMIKKGENNTRMVFDISKDTDSYYYTPYGNFHFHIRTTGLDIENKENELIILMEYNLSNNNEHISDNKLRVVIKEI